MLQMPQLRKQYGLQLAEPLSRKSCLKLFFEAGTVSAADESIAAPKRAHDTETNEGGRPRTPGVAEGEPPSRFGVAEGEPRAKSGEARVTPANVSVKPVILEWGEWALSFQNDPVVIDYGRVPDDAVTTADLSSSGIRLHMSAQAEQPERRRIP